MPRQHTILARTAIAPGAEFKSVRLLARVGVASKCKCVASAAGRRRKGQERRNDHAACSTQYECLLSHPYANVPAGLPPRPFH